MKNNKITFDDMNIVLYESPPLLPFSSYLPPASTFLLTPL